MHPTYCDALLPRQLTQVDPPHIYEHIHTHIYPATRKPHAQICLSFMLSIYTLQSIGAKSVAVPPKEVDVPMLPLYADVYFVFHLFSRKVV